jgi:membrane-associated phospholipid phosphatase
MLAGVVAKAIAKDPVPVLPPATAISRGQRGARVAWAGLAGFATTFAIVRARRSDAFDLAMTIRVQARAHPVVDRLFKVISWPGFPPQSRLIPAVVTTLLLLIRLRLEAACFLLAWGTALLATALKSLVNRPRPIAGTDLRVAVAPLGGSSFPSGHVLTYVGIYGFLAYLLYALAPAVPARRSVSAALVGLVALVGPSRIQQGHHWFTDVLASYMIGTSYLIAVASLYRRLKSRREAPS